MLEKFRIISVIKGKACNVCLFNEGHYILMKIQLINSMLSIDAVLGETIVVELNNALDGTNTM